VRDQATHRLIEEIKEQWAHEREQHETSNWLKRTGWRAHFQEWNLEPIAACSRIPANKKNHNELHRLCAALDSLFFDRCITGPKTMPLMTRL
jgi:hypothetical protein